MKKGRPKQHTPLVVVVYKKPTGNKFYLQTFEDITSDDILVYKKRNPLIPNEYDIEVVGVGHSFIEEFKKTYNIKKITEKVNN